jgi:hypothetical protein
MNFDVESSQLKSLRLGHVPKSNARAIGAGIDCIR